MRKSIEIDAPPEAVFKGASPEDPSHLFSQDGTVRRDRHT